MRVLVTGAAGFAGRYMVAELSRLGHEVWSVSREAPAPMDLPARSVVCDLTDRPAVASLVQETAPEAIVHLAGVSSVRLSWQDPIATVQANVLGTLNLLEAIRPANLDPVFLSIGSGEEYGTAAAPGKSLTEDAPAWPINPYATSKLAQGQLVMQYHKRFGLRAMHVRPFNHTGPGQATGFVVPDWARQLARIEAGLQPPVLKAGNLDVFRELMDVRDMVQAYLLLLEHGEPGQVYNVANGQAVSLSQVLRDLLQLVATPVEVIQDEALRRPAEIPFLQGDGARLFALGWKPQYSLRQTLQDVLDYWRHRVVQE